MNGDVLVSDDVAATFANVVQGAFAERDDPNRFSIAFGGGSTARNCYRALAKQEIDWSQVTAVWGDERCVPLDHDDSNYRIAKEELFDNVADLAAVHPMVCGDGGDKYNDLIADLLPLDVVHLGMGDDGHTLSMFPGSPALETPVERLVVETGDELHPHPRMTLTFSAVAKSRLAIFTITGAAKKDMFARIRNGEHLPAARIAAHRVLWIVDPEVAG